jgi:hypothetical protein
MPGHVGLVPRQARTNEGDETRALAKGFTLDGCVSLGRRVASFQLFKGETGEAGIGGDLRLGLGRQPRLRD